jgi:hypothetical protein
MNDFSPLGGKAAETRSSISADLFTIRSINEQRVSRRFQPYKREEDKEMYFLIVTYFKSPKIARLLLPTL